MFYMSNIVYVSNDFCLKSLHVKIFKFDYFTKSGRLNIMSSQRKTKEKKPKVYKLPPEEFSVPGTNFTVDWHAHTRPEYIHSFLSHAHTDHLAGAGSFRSPRIMHCTPITAKMVLLKYPKLNGVIQTHEIGSTIEIEGTKITFLNANHTPGSAMFLFELQNGKKIFHTGDFRAEPEVVATALQYGPVDKLYMDCTYALSKLSIVSRKECVSFIIDKVKDALARNSLVVIGTYTIGKEELVIEAAKATCQKIYAPTTRLESLKGLIDSGFANSDLFSSDPYETKIHLLPIADCGREKVSLYAAANGFDSVTAIRPSGWNGQPYWRLPMSDKLNEITVTTYDVPYSDHSAPSELTAFVKAIKPTTITPTTTRNQKEIEKIRSFFLPYMNHSKKKCFIEYYMTPVTSSPPRPTKPATSVSDGITLEIE